MLGWTESTAGKLSRTPASGYVLINWLQPSFPFHFYSIGLIDTELNLLGICRAISALAFEIALIDMRNHAKDASATALNTGNSQSWTQLE